MSAAYALFVDDLFEQATAYAAPFAPAGVMPVARRLYKLFLEMEEMPGRSLGWWMCGRRNWGWSGGMRGGRSRLRVRPSGEIAG